MLLETITLKICSRHRRNHDILISQNGKTLTKPMSGKNMKLIKICHFPSIATYISYYHFSVSR